MLFTSAVFLIVFLPLTVAAYWVVPRKTRIWLLLVASYVFYLSWNPRYGALLAASTVVNYALARAIPNAAHPKRLLAVGVVFNLSVLGFFKYSGLLTDSAGDLLDWLGLANTGSFDGLEVLLPLAISFFTFEMISVLVDSYRGDVRVGGFINFAAYKAFFPKLIAGPITRYRELAPQFASPAPLTLDRLQSGLALFTLGLFKKLVLADTLAGTADKGFNLTAAQSPETVAVAVAAFGLQIYFDFSAYTDMARGCSRILGLELPVNFNFPYAARTPSDFWQRWHMSLSRFLRDYLYIPLGGNRKGRANTYRNLMITMSLGGLWHGAAWQFMAWGTIHGGMLCATHALRGRFPNAGWALKALGALLTMFGVFFAWIFFRAASFGDAADVIGKLIDLPGAVSAANALAGAAVVAAFIAVNQAAPPVLQWVRERSLVMPALRPVALTSAILVLWTAANALQPSVSAPFIYFQF